MALHYYKISFLNLKIKIKDNSYERKRKVLEVDYELPNNIHSHHEDFPMAPETCNVTYDQISPFNKSLYGDMKNGDLIEGAVRVNPKNYEDAFIPDPNGKYQVCPYVKPAQIKA